MTWKEFKDKVESMGVNNEDQIHAIDVNEADFFTIYRDDVSGYVSVW